MLRAPFIALLALLAGAASACSDYVPPPGATLSGFVYVDANANGVRDSCDDDEIGLFASVQLFSRESDGPRFVAKAGRDHHWQIREVPPGDYLLALDPAPGGPPQTGEMVWLTTHPQGNAIEVSIKGYEAIGGLDIGVAYPSPIFLTRDSASVYAVIFKDTDEDGNTDTDECAIEPVLLSQLDQGNIIFSKAGEPGGFQMYPKFSGTGGDGWNSEPFWRPTRLTADGCYAAQLRKIEWFSNLYEARLGMKPAAGTSQLTVNVFEDSDGDGARGPGEPLIPKATASIAPGDGSCLFGPPMRRNTEDGRITFDNLPAAQWAVSASVGEGCYLNNGCSLVSPSATWEQGRLVGLEPGGTVEVSLGYRLEELAELLVTVIQDTNGNGAADEGEPPVASVAVCQAPPPPSATDLVEWCRPTGPTGRARFRVNNRSGLVYVGPTMTPEGPSAPANPTMWTSEGGETVSIVLLVR